MLLLFVLPIHSQWTQEKGSGYYKLGIWQLVADKHYTDTGLIDPNATRGLVISSFFGRYGLHDRLSFQLYVPFTQLYQNKQVFTSGRPAIEGELFSSLGDLDVAMEYQFLKKNSWVLSTSVLLGIPTGNDAGDGEFNQMIHMNIGRSYKIGKQYFYAKTVVGFNNRSNGYSDEWRWGFETGTRLLKSQLALLVRLNTLQSFQNGTLSAVNSNGSVFANNVEITTVGGEFVYQFGSTFGVSVGADFPISGKIIYKAPALNMGLVFQH